MWDSVRRQNSCGSLGNCLQEDTEKFGTLTIKEMIEVV